jgi:hypothetical protein
VLGGNLCAVLGDSLANNGEGIAYWLSALSKQKFHFRSAAYVRSYPGERSDQTLARVAEVTGLPVKPRFCLISTGSNDAAVGVSAATFQANLLAIIAALRAAGITPILMTVPPRSAVYGTISEYNFRIARIASANSYPLIDAFAVLANPATEQYLSAYLNDGIHPNPAGCQAVASRAITDLGNALPARAEVTALSAGLNMYPGAAHAVDSNADGLSEGYTASLVTGFTVSRVSDAAGFWWQRMTLASPGAAKTVLGTTLNVGSGSGLLTSSAAAAATSIVLDANIAAGMYKITDSLGTYEYVKVNSVAGSGPYTATLNAATPLRAAHSVGASVAPAFAVGDTLALAVRFRNGQDSAKFVPQFTFYVAGQGSTTGNLILSSPNSVNGFTKAVTDAIGYAEYVVPATTATIQFSMVGGATDGTYDFALPFMANLTALGIA